MTHVIGLLSRWGLRLAFLICGFVGGACADETLGSPKADPPAAASPADWRTLSSEDFKKVVKDLLYAAKYDHLDSMVAEINEQQLRTADGDSALGTFFLAVSKPRDLDDPEDWKVLFQRLMGWKARSNTIYTATAIGRTQVNYAWQARTGAPTRRLSPEQLQVFVSAIAQASDTLSNGLQMPGHCVELYARLMWVGIAQGWPLEKMNATLDEALTVVPDYYPCLIAMAVYTSQNWHGKPGDMEKFLASIPGRIPGDHGYETYVRTAMDLQPIFRKNFIRNGAVGTADWPTLKKGFEVISRTYPGAWRDRNQFAACACLAKDRPTARRLFDDLTARHQVMAEVWSIAGGLEAAKKWLADEPVSQKPEGAGGDGAGPGPANLLANANFQKGLDGWAVDAWAKKGHAEPDNEERHQDHPSLRIQNAEWGNVYVSQKITVKPNTRYRLSGWIKTRDVEDQKKTGTAGATLWIGGGWDATRLVGQSEDWTYVELDVESGAKTKIEIGPRLGNWGDTVMGTAWFADLSLAELPPAASGE